MDTVATWMNSTNFSVIATITITFLLATLGAKIIGYIVKQSVRTAREKTWHPKDVEKRQKTLSELFKNIWRVIIIAIGILTLMQTLMPKFNYAPLFATAGIFGVALGFGAQSLVKDFISGIFIISENQYRIGDIIDIGGDTGKVERISTRSTIIRDDNGNVHYFPNGTIQHVINKTMGYSMARFTIDVLPSSDMSMIIKTINKTGKKLAGEEKWTDKIIEPPSFVSIGEFTSKTVTVIISGKTQPSDQWSVTAEMRRRLLVAFEQNDIKLS